MRAICLVLSYVFACSIVAAAQEPARTQFDRALDQALAMESLDLSPKPFHVVMTISGPTPVYSGTIELTWAAPNQYLLALDTPGFKQLRVVNHSDVLEQNQGDYLPRWLETFTTALLDLKSLTANFQGRQETIAVGDSISSSCVTRDDRPGGITEQTTWGILCFAGSEPRLNSILTFNVSLQLSDFRSFGKQQIPRTLSTDVLDYKTVTGRLTTLEEVQPPADKFRINAPTLPADQIHSAMVSTLAEEAMIETAPTVSWPTVREGKTEGYMIVYARTDRTGQVRESAKHNSDQPGLEQFGMEQALKFKFHPMLVNGVPVEMEMPLVLHFKSSLADPLPILNDEQMRAQISGCKFPHPKPGQQPFRVRLSINEVGKLTGETFLDANVPNAPHRSSVEGLPSFRQCTFAPYLVNGKPTYYHGDLLLP